MIKYVLLHLTIPYYLRFSFQYVPDWELSKQFVVEQLQVALESDSYEWSLPLSSDVQTPSEIDNRFDDISYDKGSTM